MGRGIRSDDSGKSTGEAVSELAYAEALIRRYRWPVDYLMHGIRKSQLEALEIGMMENIERENQRIEGGRSNPYSYGAYGGDVHKSVVSTKADPEWEANIRAKYRNRKVN